MKQRWFICSVGVLAAVALSAQWAQAGPTSGGRSYQYRVGASASNSRVVVSPAPIVEPALYSYYAPPARNSSSAGGEEEQELATPKAATIEVQVPANAQIIVDGVKTNQTGSSRTFITPPLEPGKTFSYEMRVQWAAPDGLAVELTRTVHIKAGRETRVGFIWR